jgi:Zn-finger domain-containing protein
MKNEREKEIEHANPLNRYSGGLFKQRDKVKQQITDQQQQSVNISISRLQREIKKQREMYMW